MSENKMVKIPWYDGTDREVEVGTACEVDAGYLRYADDAGYQNSRGDIGDGDPIGWWDERVVRVFVEGSEPPLPLPELPTEKGAVCAEFYPDGKATGWTLTLANDGVWRTQQGDPYGWSNAVMRRKIAYGFGGFTYRIVFDGAGSTISDNKDLDND